MASTAQSHDPLEFVRNMWNNMGFSMPGMMTPTVDVDELDKRIADLKAVENWLKMNLNMLQMTTQGLEMQRAAIHAVQAMSQHAQQSGQDSGSDNPFAAASSLWWNMMQQAAQTASSVVPTSTDTTAKNTSSTSKG